jgi:hypothetical protein
LGIIFAIMKSALHRQAGRALRAIAFWPRENREIFLDGMKYFSKITETNPH